MLISLFLKINSDFLCQIIICLRYHQELERARGTFEASWQDQLRRIRLEQDIFQSQVYYIHIELFLNLETYKLLVLQNFITFIN